jgi:hypothetical protein
MIAYYPVPCPTCHKEALFPLRPLQMSPNKMFFEFTPNGGITTKQPVRCPHCSKVHLPDTVFPLNETQTFDAWDVFWESLKGTVGTGGISIGGDVAGNITNGVVSGAFKFV